jgi:hypothetical protein
VVQTCPIHIARNIERRWQQRLSAGYPALSNDAGAGYCPKCNQPPSIGATSSDYRGNGIIHHRRLWTLVVTTGSASPIFIRSLTRYLRS